MFLGCPSYFTSTKVSTKRYTRESKDKENFAKCLQESLIAEEREKLRFAVDTFEDFKQKLPDINLKHDWIIWYSSCNTLHLIRLELSNPYVKIVSTLTINSDLTISAISCEYQVRLPLAKITDLRQIENLIDHIENFQPNSDVFESDPVLVNIKEASERLRSAVSILENSESTIEFLGESQNTYYLPSLQFLICQLENSLVPINQRRYNVITQVSFLLNNF